MTNTRLVLPQYCFQCVDTLSEDEHENVIFVLITFSDSNSLEAESLR